MFCNHIKIMETLTFKRGGDVKTTIGIGEIEGLRIKLEKLKEHPAVTDLYISRGLGIDNEVTEKKLGIQVNFKYTDEHYDHIDDFLIQYLPAHFFSSAHIEDNSMIEGMSVDLGELRRKPTWFYITLTVHTDYTDTFPTVHKF